MPIWSGISCKLCYPFLKEIELVARTVENLKDYLVQICRRIYGSERGNGKEFMDVVRGSTS
jgi:hypothetical protein